MFTESTLTEQLGTLGAERGELRRGFGVTVVNGGERPSSLPTGVKFVRDQGGRARQIRGLAGKESGPLAYDTKGKVLLQTNRVEGIEALRNVLGTLWLHPRVAAHLRPVSAQVPITE